MTRFEPMPRPTCHGEELPAALANAPARERENPEPVTGSDWWQSLTDEERAAAIRRSF